jgi:hypothetical protein
MKRFFKIIVSILKYALYAIIALAFWFGVFYLYVLWLPLDKPTKPSQEIIYKIIELDSLKIGTTFDGDYFKKTTIGGIIGKVHIDPKYDTTNNIVDEIFFFIVNRDIEETQITTMIKDIESTFNIHFISAPMSSNIDLYAIKDSVEFDCSYSTSYFFFTMTRWHKKDEFNF